MHWEYLPQNRFVEFFYELNNTSCRRSNRICPHNFFPGAIYAIIVEKTVVCTILGFIIVKEDIDHRTVAMVDAYGQQFTHIQRIFYIVGTNHGTKDSFAEIMHPKSFQQIFTRDEEFFLVCNSLE